MDLAGILSHLLPEEINRYFDLKKIEESTQGRLLFHLDEKSNKAISHKEKLLVSNGFDEAVQIQDFPLRDKSVYLIVRRRKWVDKQTGKIYTTNWNLTTKGTSYTKEFASFLKEFLR